MSKIGWEGQNVCTYLVRKQISKTCNERNEKFTLWN